MLFHLFCFGFEFRFGSRPLPLPWFLLLRGRQEGAARASLSTTTPSIMKNNPDNTMTENCKIIGEMWNKLYETQKAKYEKLAEKS